MAKSLAALSMHAHKLEYAQPLPLLAPKAVSSSYPQVTSTNPGMPSLPVHLLEELLRQGTIFRYPAGGILFREDDKPDHVFVLLSGQLMVYSIGNNDQEIVYNVLQPGEILGEMMLDGGLRSASVKALTDAECCVITGEVAIGLLRNTPDFAEYLVHKLIWRVRHLTRQNRSLALNDVYERVAALLEEQAIPDGDTRRIPRVLTQQEIASRIGASREMVGKILRNLIHGGFIAKDADRRMVIVKKLPKGW